MYKEFAKIAQKKGAYAAKAAGAEAAKPAGELADVLAKYGEKSPQKISGQAVEWRDQVKGSVKFNF